MKNLTLMYHEDRAVGNTHPGMAHFAGTGPDNRTCRECCEWHQLGYYAASNKKHGPTLKPGGCRKYAELMKKEVQKVPHSASVCRWFVENQSPPPIRTKS